jgi:hypothetical protein
MGSSELLPNLRAWKTAFEIAFEELHGLHPAERLSSWDNSACLTFHRHFRLHLRIEEMDILVLKWCSDSESCRDYFHHKGNGRQARPTILCFIDAISSMSLHILAKFVYGASLQASQFWKDRMLRHQLALPWMDSTRTQLPMILFLQLQKYSGKL